METLNLKQEEPHTDNHHHHHHHYDESSGCGSCFGFFRLKDDRASEKRQGLGETTASWAAERIGKAREWSEVIAGPKWKNFVRKVGGYFTKKKKKHTANFQYDPQSYALNFDSGFGREDAKQEKELEGEEEEENGPLLLR